MDYEVGLQAADLVKVDTLLGGEEVDALSFIVHRDVAQTRGRMCEKLKERDPAPDVRGRRSRRPSAASVIARENGPRPRARTSPPSATAATSPASASCSRSRRRARSRMKQVGRVEIPQKAFLAVLASEDD
jgi:GTP-binding protein LepA